MVPPDDPSKDAPKPSAEPRPDPLPRSDRALEIENRDLHAENERLRAELGRAAPALVGSVGTGGELGADSDEEDDDEEDDDEEDVSSWA